MPELLLLTTGGAAAGVFGALLGLGGGVLIVPLLTLVFGLPLREAVGVSLVCVIVTSNASAAVYLERRLANLRLGMTLELFTAMAALGGSLIAFALPDRALAVLFAALLVYVAVAMARSHEEAPGASEQETGTASDGGTGPALLPPASEVGSVGLSGPGYEVRNMGWGVAGSLFAGLVSALFGIGGGIVKVPVMHLVMGVPLRVATATSNLMIGVTASTGAVVYLFRGGIDPYVAAPTAAGAFVGASLASRLGHRVDLRALRLVFVVVLLAVAGQMVLRGLV